jgi:hypothetical protein
MLEQDDASGDGRGGGALAQLLLLQANFLLWFFECEGFGGRREISGSSATSNPFP